MVRAAVSHTARAASRRSATLLVSMSGFSTASLSRRRYTTCSSRVSPASLGSSSASRRTCSKSGPNSWIWSSNRPGISRRISSSRCESLTYFSGSSRFTRSSRWKRRAWPISAAASRAGMARTRSSNSGDASDTGAITWSISGPSRCSATSARTLRPYLRIVKAPPAASRWRVRIRFCNSPQRRASPT